MRLSTVQYYDYRSEDTLTVRCGGSVSRIFNTIIQTKWAMTLLTPIQYIYNIPPSITLLLFFFVPSARNLKENVLYLFIFENYIEMTEIPHFFKISSSSWTSSLSLIYIYRMFIINFLGEKSLGISGLVCKCCWWCGGMYTGNFQDRSFSWSWSFLSTLSIRLDHLFPNDNWTVYFLL